MIRIIVSSQGFEGDSGQLYIWGRELDGGGRIGESLNKKRANVSKLSGKGVKT